MKKMVFAAVAACAMMFASCGGQMKPEAVQAWNKVKELAPALTSIEGVAQYATVADWSAAVQEFNTALQEMGKYEYTKEISDSLTAMLKQFEETSNAAAANIQARVDAAAAEAEAAAEAVEGEEVVEE